MARAQPPSLRFVDLCAGLGGFHVGLERLEGWTFECVLASELDPELREIYPRNFPHIAETYQREFPPERVAKLLRSADEKSERAALDLYSSEGKLRAVHGDLRALVDEERETLRAWPDAADEQDWIVPPHDLLCAGFPCQPFSKSGTQRGFGDLRGTVFYLIAMVLRARQPAMVLLENVGNFDRHDGGNTWQRVRETLEGMGYDVAATRHKTSGSDARGLLSPHHLGLPQHRERFFIIAQHREKCDWTQPLVGRYPFPPRPASTRQQELEDRKARASLHDIVATSWSGEEDALPEAQLSEDRVTCVERWNELLAMLDAADERGASPPWRYTMPSFPIWGFELDPWQWYPDETNPKDWLSDPGQLVDERARRLQKTREEVLEMSAGAVDLWDHPPGGEREWLGSVSLDHQRVEDWVALWPGYARLRPSWPDWKQRFIRQNREWARALWSRLRTPAELRAWLDRLYKEVPAPSNQKLEWNCKGEELDLWEHILQFRPSGLRVKRLIHVPALVAMTTTQTPVVPRINGNEPVIGDPRSRGRHLLRSEALRLLGFDATWQHPSARDKAFQSFGNAVHCDVVTAVFEHWLSVVPEANPAEIEALPGRPGEGTEEVA